MHVRAQRDMVTLELQLLVAAYTKAQTASERRAQLDKIFQERNLEADDVLEAFQVPAAPARARVRVSAPRCLPVHRPPLGLPPFPGPWLSLPAHMAL
jgi:hypothetical protein